MSSSYTAVKRLTWRNITVAVAALALALVATPLWAQGNAKKPAEIPGMVYVPAGPFIMGDSGKGLDEDAYEGPINTVTLAAFYIDKCEVTNAQYAVFLNATGKLQDAAGHAYLRINPNLMIEQKGGKWQPKPGKDNYPMVNVTWYGARAYAHWAGKRLPTEAEWEKAARGTDGRKYPWGNKMDPTRFKLGEDNILPVGSFPKGASPYGCLDMVGNVWEWTSSLFKPYPYVATDGREDPNAPGRRVARGGSWSGEPNIAQVCYRFRPYPDFAQRYLGFRCAKSAK